MRRFRTAGSNSTICIRLAFVLFAANVFAVSGNLSIAEPDLKS